MSASSPQTQSQPLPDTANNTTSTPPAPTNNPIQPATSTSATDTRPRDARTIHLILSQMGVSAYQERVPLQLLDFAYRYTAGILSDAQHLASEGYTGANSGKSEEVNLQAVRMAAASRQINQFTGGKESKEQLLERAAEINKVRLPRVEQGPKFGVRLPHERFLLTGRSWDLNAQWEMEDAEEEEGGVEAAVEEKPQANGDKEDEDMEEEDAEEGDGGFTDVFGEEQEEDDAKMEEGRRVSGGTKLVSYI